MAAGLCRAAFFFRISFGSFLACGSTVDTCSSTVALFSWLRERGGRTTVECRESGGLRGLVATRDAKVGDVLLEVPLAATLADGTSGEKIPGLVTAGPDWAADLPWNVQLALGALRFRKENDWAPFLDSWPTQAPLLPKDFDAEDLEEAQDEDFAVDADRSFFWVDGQYEFAREAHEEAGVEEPFPTEDEFKWALAHVWSRNCRFDLGSNGVRRLLVPVLDMGNHDSSPSAFFAYSEAASCGPAVRLYAVRSLQAGDTVTYTYGRQPNSYFMQYYGFVPQHNPFDAVEVSMSEVLGLLPESVFPPPPGGWDAALQAIEFEGMATTQLQLRNNAPDEALMRALCTLLSDDTVSDLQVEANAVQAIASACAEREKSYETSIEEDEEFLGWQTGVDGIEDDDGLSGAQVGVVGASVAVLLLVQLRLGRKRLVRELGFSMQAVADEYRRSPDTARERLNLMFAEPSVYPEMEDLPSGELEVETWNGRVWDWDAHAYADAQADSTV